MRLLPRVGLIVFLGRGHVDCVVKPTVPARRRHRGLSDAVIDHPPPFEPERGIDAWLAIVGVAELIVAHQLAEAAGVEPRVEIRAVPPGEIVQQKLFEPIRHLVERRVRVEIKRKGLRAADYGETEMMRQAELFPAYWPKAGLRARPDSADGDRPHWH